MSPLHFSLGKIQSSRLIKPLIFEQVITKFKFHFAYANFLIGAMSSGRVHNVIIFKYKILNNTVTKKELFCLNNGYSHA